VSEEWSYGVLDRNTEKKKKRCTKQRLRLAGEHRRKKESGGGGLGFCGVNQGGGKKLKRKPKGMLINLRQTGERTGGKGREGVFRKCGALGVFRVRLDLTLRGDYHVRTVELRGEMRNRSSG